MLSPATLRIYRKAIGRQETQVKSQGLRQGEKEGRASRLWTRRRGVKSSEDHWEAEGVGWESSQGHRAHWGDPDNCSEDEGVVGGAHARGHLGKFDQKQRVWSEACQGFGGWSEPAEGPGQRKGRANPEGSRQPVAGRHHFHGEQPAGHERCLHVDPGRTFRTRRGSCTWHGLVWEGEEMREVSSVGLHGCDWHGPRPCQEASWGFLVAKKDLKNPKVRLQTRWCSWYILHF